jgi:hypothetical protein
MDDKYRVPVPGGTAPMPTPSQTPPGGEGYPSPLSPQRPPPALDGNNRPRP